MVLYKIICHRQRIRWYGLHSEKISVNRIVFEWALMLDFAHEGIIQKKVKGKTTEEKTEQSTTDLWDGMKQSNIHKNRISKDKDCGRKKNISRNNGHTL